MNTHERPSIDADVTLCDVCSNTAIYTDGHTRGCAKHPPSGEGLTPIAPFSFVGKEQPCDMYITVVIKNKKEDVRCGIPTQIKWEADGRYFCEQHATEVIRLVHKDGGKKNEVPTPTQFHPLTVSKTEGSTPEDWRDLPKKWDKYFSGPFITEQEGGGKRTPVDFRFDLLNPEFLKAMAMIAHHGSVQYDATPNQAWGQLNYQLDQLVGEKSPLNHALSHIIRFMMGIPYERYDGNKSWHLVAAAYNLHMHYYHIRKDEENGKG